MRRPPDPGKGDTPPDEDGVHAEQLATGERNIVSVPHSETAHPACETAVLICTAADREAVTRAMRLTATVVHTPEDVPADLLGRSVVLLMTAGDLLRYRSAFPTAETLEVPAGVVLADLGAREIRALMTPAWGSATCNDDSNAQRFVRDHRDDARYLIEDKVWLVWDDRSGWVRDTGDLRVTALALDTARRIVTEAGEMLAAGREAEGKAMLRWADQSRSASRLRSTLELARGPLACSVAAFDTDGTVWGFANGVVELATGAFRPYRRDDLISIRSELSFDPDAECPTWLRFLTEVQPDADTREYLRRALGYSVTGVVREHLLHICYGATGRNGKGTLLSAVSNVLGPHHTALSQVVLYARDPRDTKHHLASLDRRRMASTDELPAGRGLNLEAVKMLTSGDPVLVEEKYRDPRTMRSVAKLWINTNDRPVIPADADAAWSRVVLIPFSQCFIGREDEGLRDRLADEAAGIARWLVEAARDYLAHGLPAASVEIARATVGYRQDMDAVGAFLAAEPDALDDFPPTTVVMARLVEWCEAEGRDVPTQRQVTAALKRAGWVNKSHGNGFGSSYRAWHRPPIDTSTQIDITSNISPKDLSHEKEFSETTSMSVDVSMTGFARLFAIAATAGTIDEDVARRECDDLEREEWEDAERLVRTG